MCTTTPASHVYRYQFNILNFDLSLLDRCQVSRGRRLRVRLLCARPRRVRLQAVTGRRSPVLRARRRSGLHTQRGLSMRGRSNLQEISNGHVSFHKSVSYQMHLLFVCSTEFALPRWRQLPQKNHSG